MKVLVFGGTTEGRLLAWELLKRGLDVTVSVATPLGAEELSGLPGLDIWVGRKEAQELEQAKEKAADLKSSAVAVQKEYDKIMSWADLYAGSSIEGKKMILRQLIERVNIGKNFEIEVEFKISVTQFFDFLHPEGDKSVYYRAS